MADDTLSPWLDEVLGSLPAFLERMRDPGVPGRFRYSLTGDIEAPRSWGLGNSVFAAKCYYMVNALESAPAEDMVKFIKTFQAGDGHFYDPLVQKESYLRRWYNAVRYGEWNNLTGIQTRRAETRQAFSALRSLGGKPDVPFMHIPYTAQGVRKYIRSLNWRLPWAAGSHFSHLIFFLRANYDMFGTGADDWEELIDCAFREADRYRQRDGAWYPSEIPLPDVQKVNGAMKMMVAYESAPTRTFTNPEGLIDLCLAAANDETACDNFNIVCVLYHCSRKTDYRLEEIRRFCRERIEIYRRHYWPQVGGFSFLERQANAVYYGAKISRGLPEPDIHGTHLFLWGIALITKIMGIEKALYLRVPIT